MKDTPTELFLKELQNASDWAEAEFEDPVDVDVVDAVEDEGDLFYNLKTDESIPLIAEIRTGSSTIPLVHYDKFEIFDDPFLTSSPSSYSPIRD